MSRQEPVTSEKTPPRRVLVVEEEEELRHLLAYVLRRHGLDVTEECPARANLLNSEGLYDAVVFNVLNTSLHRRRWLFGYKPPMRRTRLVALQDRAPEQAPGRHAVDVTLPYPVSASVLVRAVTGDSALTLTADGREQLRRFVRLRAPLRKAS